MKRIQIQKVFLLFLFAGVMASAANGQTISQNIVGYVNVDLSPGTNFIANQFDNGQGNTLDTLFQLGETSSAIPEGAMFTELSPATGQFLPVSTYDTASGWSINYALTYGEGGVLIAPTLFANTFLGTVSSAFNPTTDVFTPPLVTGGGLMLLSCVVPLGAETFYDVVGRNPQNGEWVTTLDATTQVYSTTTFEDGAWNNGAPDLSVGQSALFYLDPVPEPSVAGLGAAGLLALAWRRLRQV
jgi:hypothetical protein